MHEDSSIGINSAHMFSWSFKSLHTLLGFALYFVSSILIIVAVTIYSIFDLFVEIHTAKTGLFEVLS